MYLDPNSCLIPLHKLHYCAARITTPDTIPSCLGPVPRDTQLKRDLSAVVPAEIPVNAEVRVAEVRTDVSMQKCEQKCFMVRQRCLLGSQMCALDCNPAKNCADVHVVRRCASEKTNG